MIKLIKAGVSTSIQDQGRFGYRKHGVPLSGAMDAYAAYVANVLVGNSADTAVLEFTLVGPTLLFEKSCTVAVSGGDFEMKLNGQTMPVHSTIIIHKGDILRISASRIGAYGYLACSSLLDVEVIMGSASMYSSITSRARFANEDTIELGETEALARTQNSRLKYNDSYLQNPMIQVYKGPEFDQVPSAMQAQFFNKMPFKIASSSNRMATMFVHNLELIASEIITSPVQPGTIQLTPNGQLIALMRDAQTTGGYARVLQLPEQSINQLAQKRPNTPVYFELIE